MAFDVSRTVPEGLEWKLSPRRSHQERDVARPETGCLAKVADAWMSREVAA